MNEIKLFNTIHVIKKNIFLRAGEKSLRKAEQILLSYVASEDYVELNTELLCSISYDLPKIILAVQNQQCKLQIKEALYDGKHKVSETCNN